VRPSTLNTGRFYPPPPWNIPGIHFCYKLSRPQGLSTPGRYHQWNIPMTSSRIELENFRIVEQCLNQLRVHKFVLYFIFACLDFAASLFEIADVDTVCSVWGLWQCLLQYTYRDMIGSLVFVILHTHTHKHSVGNYKYRMWEDRQMWWSRKYV
jgi:hypothetical protein